MIRVKVELTTRSGPKRMWVKARSIRRAVHLTALLHPGSEPRVVFPINEGEFFLEEKARTFADEGVSA